MERLHKAVRALAPVAVARVVGVARVMVAVGLADVVARVGLAVAVARVAPVLARRLMAHRWRPVRLPPAAGRNSAKTI